MISDARGRDIDLLLVTGAGASRDFGAQAPLPLMEEFNDAIVSKLSTANYAYVEAVGLHPRMSGTAFETQLGLFLRQIRALAVLEGVLPATTKLYPGALPGFDHQLIEWHRQTVTQFAQIADLIHTTLFELFGASNVDIEAASRAYSSLLAALDITEASTLVLATTNYDAVAEGALARLGRLPDWGEVAALEGDLQLRTLLDGMPRYVPILHLHGRVGWYRRTEANSERLYTTRSPRHDRNFGAPVVMLPDPEKAYDDEVLVSLWQNFRNALQRAKRVLVLGHSLNDRVLVETLRDDVPASILAITVLPKKVNPSDYRMTVAALREEAIDPALEDRLRRDFPGAAVIPVRFQPNMDAATLARLAEWRETSTPTS